MNAAPLYLSHVSKDFSFDNMKKTGFYRYAYDFSVDCNGSEVNDILHMFINKLIKKTQYKTMFEFIKNYVLDYYGLAQQIVLKNH